MTAKKSTTTRKAAARKRTATATPEARDLDDATLPAKADVGQDEVEAKLDAEQERGYRGFAPGGDADLSVAGVTGKNPPTGLDVDESGRQVQPVVPS